MQRQVTMRTPTIDRLAS
jgi:hypothetical protein